MLLIIAHHYDVEAAWLRDTLAAYQHPVILLLPEALGIDYNISLHLSDEGKHDSGIVFYEPRLQLKGSRIRYAINRLSYIDPVVWQQAAPAEKKYATEELNAFFPAFIHALPCPLSNPVHNGSLYGDGGFARRWAGRLHRQGIAIHPLVTDIPGKLYDVLNATPQAQLWRLMYFEKKVFTPHGQEAVSWEGTIKECLRQFGGEEMMELTFLKEDAHFSLLQVSKAPALSLYGQPFIEAILHLPKQMQHDHTDGHTQRAAACPAC